MTQINLSLWQLIIYFGIANTLLLATLLLFSHKNKKASLSLAMLIIVVAVNYLDMEAFSYLYRNVSWYYINRISLEYTFGVLYIFYVRSLLRLNFKIDKKSLPLILPFIFTVIYDILRAIYVANWVPFSNKLDYLYIQNEFLILEGPAILLMLYCYYLSFKEISSYQNRVRGNFSSIDQRILPWLKFLTYFALFNTLIWLGYYAAELIIYPDILSFPDYYPLWGFTIFLLMIIGYKNLMQPELMATLKVIAVSNRTKYQTSKLSETDIANLSVILNDKMAQEKYYRKSDLNLNEFSQLVNIPSHQVSQALNQGLHMNFYDFINSFRVEEIKSRLKEHESNHLTLWAMALEAGFNSKNSFNNAFKKFTSKTPSAYKKTEQQ